ncbi:MAG: T9SS type A sorting domain-containing protein [Bacteroidales bacterium]|nr:T9SS type A sorting domain-containing protein [Bacteroidales bacterium]
MKYLIGFITAFIFLAGLNGQGIISSGAINGNGDITIIQSESSSNGDIYVFGHFTGTIDYPSVLGTSLGGRDYFIAKIDSSLKVQWLSQLSSPLSVYVYGGITVDANNDVYVTGGFRNYIRVSDADSIFSSGAFDTFLAKYDASGTPLWLKAVGEGGRNERPNALSVDLSGDLLIGAFFSDSIQFDDNLTLYSDDGIDDYFYGKFDPNTGDRIWARQIIGINNNLSGRIFDIVATSDSYYMTGPYADSIGFENDTIVSVNNNYDVHLIKTDLDGNVNWVRSIKGDLADNSWSLTTDENDNVYIAGWYDTPAGLIVDSTDSDEVTFPGSDGDEQLNVFIAKYDTQGTLQWIRAGDRANHGGIVDEKIFDIEIFGGQLNVCGYYENVFTWGANTLTSNGPGDFNMFVASMTFNGEYRSAVSYSRQETKNGYEASRTLFQRGDELYVVIESTSTRLVYQDSIYDNTDGLLMVAILQIGCLPLAIGNTVVTDVVGCNGDSKGSIQIVVSADSSGWGSPYLFSIDNGSTYQESPFFDELPAGTYNPVIYDSRGCTFAGDPIVIDQPDPIVIDTNSESVLCFGDNSGSITINVTGGVSPYQYSSDGGTTFQAASTFSALTFGDYPIQVLDSDACLAEGDTIEITQPESPLTIALVSTTDVPCNGKTNGAIEVSADGGTKPYEYSIDGSNYQAEATLGSLSAGTYTPLVLDANDCVTQLDAVVTIDEPKPLTISIDSIKSKQGNDLGLIIATASGETGNYTFSIDPAIGNQDEPGKFTNLDKGIYTVTVTDDLCNSTDSESSIEIVGFFNLEYIPASIYPNPSSGMVTVEFTTDKQEMTLEIFSIDGRSVMHRQVYSAGGQVRETLDLSGLDKGMYMLRIDQQTLTSGVVLK